MTINHPINPTPDLIVKWASSMCGYYEAAQWGADQELEACINYFYEYDRQRWGENSKLITGLRAARRPKPPSLKEQALERLELAKKYIDVEPILRALEVLPE
jgi:hypothetical protein